MGVQDGLLQDTAGKFRASLAARESHATTRIASDWKRAYRHIEGELLVLQDQIRQHLETHDDVPVSWLVSNRQYQKVLETAEQEIERFAGTQLEETVRLRRQAVVDSITHADDLKAVVSQSIDPSLNPAVKPEMVGDVLKALSETDPGRLADLAVGPTAFGGAFEGAVREAVASLEPGSPLRDLFAEWGPDGSKQMRSSLLKHVALSSNPRVFAREVRRELEHLGRARAETIARTEMLRASREATRASFQLDPSVEGWIWLSAADSRTCPACWVMHGTFHSLDERLDGHPSCRCAMVPKPEGVDISSLGIRSGEELFGELDEATQIRIMGPKRHDRWKAGKIGWDENVVQIPNAKWGSMRTTPSLKSLGFTGPKKKVRRKPKAKQAPPVPKPPPPPTSLGPAPRPSRLRNLLGSKWPGTNAKGRGSKPGWFRKGKSSDAMQKAENMRNLGKRLMDSKRVSAEQVVKLRAFMESKGHTRYFGYGRSGVNDLERAIDDVASTFIGTWAMTSSDKNPWSFAMQRAAHKEFGLSDEGLNWLKDASSASWTESTAILREHEDVLTALVRAMYEETQDLLKKEGIESVSLMRGIKVPGGTGQRSALRVQERDDIMLNPLSSFSTNFETHTSFRADRSIVLEVPRERIIGVSRSGFGCRGEYECVVLGPQAGETYRGHFWDGPGSYLRYALHSEESRSGIPDLATAQERLVQSGEREIILGS